MKKNTLLSLSVLLGSLLCSPLAVFSLDAPSLTKKSMETGTEGVISILESAKHIDAPNDVRDMSVKTFESLPEAYTFEIRAKVDTTGGRGLDVEVRDANKKGFRTSVDKASMYNMAVQNVPVKLETPAAGDTYRTYRYAVKDGKVHVYVDGAYYATMDLQEGMKPNNLVDNGGFEFDESSGWTDPCAGWSNPTGWGRDIIDEVFYTGTHSLNFPSWHGSNTIVTQYVAPLEEGEYTYSFYAIKREGTDYRWGLSLDNNANFLNGQWNGLNQGEWTLASYDFEVTDATKDLTVTYWEWNNGTAVAIDDVELLPKEDATITPYISFGKNFVKNGALLDIEYANYDFSGAYAPIMGSTAISESAADETVMYYSNGYIYIDNAGEGVLDIYSAAAGLCASVNVAANDEVAVDSLPSGVYIAKVGDKSIKFVK